MFGSEDKSTVQSKNRSKDKIDHDFHCLRVLGTSLPTMQLSINEQVSSLALHHGPVQILSKSFQHGGRYGCNAFAKHEKHR